MEHNNSKIKTTGIFNLLEPDETVPSLSAIDLNKLRLQGFRGIILDLDNTSTPWNQDIFTTEALVFIKMAQELNFRLCLLSNTTYKRGKRMAELLGLPFIAPALKPRKKPFLRALEKLNTQNGESLVIGDQIFTDILGGNRAGCYTIQVDPLAKKEFMGTKFLRLMESFLTSFSGKPEE